MVGRQMNHRFNWRYEMDAHLCNVGAAIIGAGALGAGASIWGANRAADAQTSAANSAIAAQQGMFSTAKQGIQPFVDAGQGTIAQLKAWLDPNNASGPLSSLQRLTTPGPDQSAALEQTPGFQFANQYGQKAVRNSLAARGLAGPGGALARGGADYAENLAGGTWQNVVGALQNLFSSGGNALQNLVNTGASSASSLGNQAVQVGQGIGNNLVGIGNAQAGAATATAGALGGFGNSLTTAALLSKLTGGGNGGLYGTDSSLSGGAKGVFA